MNNWATQIDQNTESFINAFGNLSHEQLNWKPEPQTWSIAQNIDHLIVINESYFPLIQQIKNEKTSLPFIARSGFMVNFLGKTILKSVQPNRKRKMKTFPIWEPRSISIEDGILERFKTHHEALKELIEISEDLINKGTVIPSPANKNIVYKLETAFDIIVTHEQRHLEQAKEVLGLMASER